MSGFELRLTVPAASAAPESTAPERVTLWSCIGCGARGMPDVCTGACDDRPVEYVRAIDLDAVLAAAGPPAQLAEALRDLAAEVAGAAPAGNECERTWRTWRDRARALHAAWPETPRLAEAERIAGWFCGACGRIESPQPCL
ncbi:MAG TPA: hypothetical protein VN213_12295, partial [Solirubrobacteraceae bacterium]|nr:hypothetical protein [Solirubrobacteraceae bacterium]